MISRQTSPTVILKGITSTITLDLRDDAGTAATITSAKVTISRRGAVVVGPVAATVAGGVASYALDGTATSTESPSADWLATWTDVVVAAPAAVAATYQGIRQALILAVDPLFCPITDADLTDESPSLAEIIPPGEASYEKWRVAAFQRLIRRLKRAGKIAALVLDADALVDVLIADTLAAIYREHVTSIGDGRYLALSQYYEKRAADEWAALVLRYDRDGNGRMTEDDTAPGVGVLFTARPPRRA